MLLLFVIAVGLISICIISAISNLHDHITQETFRLHRHLLDLEKSNIKTRKDQQEIKTRLTQVRKDLNNIERKIPIYSTYTK